MYKARYYKADGKKGKARALPDALFDGVVNESVMHRVVQVYLANQRQGAASAKTRSEVRGGSRKPWRQKGTGRARQGTIRAVQWAGGGVAFPPIPHSWRQRVPKKVKALARRSAFNARAEGDRVVLADMPSIEAPKTKEIVNMIAGIDGATGKVLILTAGLNETVYRSARNLAKVRVMPFGEESVYDLLWAHTVVIEPGALDAVDSGADPSDEDAEPAPKKKAPKKKAAAKSEPAVDEAAKPAPKKTAPKKKVSAEAAPEVEAAAESSDEPVADAGSDASADEEKDDA